MTGFGLIGHLVEMIRYGDINNKNDDEDVDKKDMHIIFATSKGKIRK